MMHLRWEHRHVECVGAKGRITTRNGGRTLAKKLTAGVMSGSEGLLVCSSAGSSIEAEETLTVGNEGLGTMDVVNGSTVSPTSPFAACNPDFSTKSARLRMAECN